MTRIIAGRARGRRVKIPSAGTRPTSDRLREALFASVESRLRAVGRGWQDVAVADLCPSVLDDDVAQYAGVVGIIGATVLRLVVAGRTFGFN